MRSQNLSACHISCQWEKQATTDTVRYTSTKIYVIHVYKSISYDILFDSNSLPSGDICEGGVRALPTARVEVITAKRAERQEAPRDNHE